VIPFPLENKAKDNKPTERMAATRELYLRPREHNTERGGYLEGIDQNRASFFLGSIQGREGWKKFWLYHKSLLFIPFSLSC
jgi:hypothetical protein